METETTNCKEVKYWKKHMIDIAKRKEARKEQEGKWNEHDMKVSHVRDCVFGDCVSEIL